MVTAPVSFWVSATIFAVDYEKVLADVMPTFFSNNDQRAIYPTNRRTTPPPKTISSTALHIKATFQGSHLKIFSSQINLRHRLHCFGAHISELAHKNSRPAYFAPKQSMQVISNTRNAVLKQPSAVLFRAQRECAAWLSNN